MDDRSLPASFPYVRLLGNLKVFRPWVLWKEVEKPQERIAPGTVVDVLDREGKWVARGFYNGHARVRLRLLTQNQEEQVDRAFLETRLREAIHLRRQWLKLDAVTDAYRLVHSEGDGLSGLVVDRFGSLVVIQFFAAGMFKWRDTIREILSEEVPGCHFYSFSEPHIQKQESYDHREEAAPEPFVIHEYSLQFNVAPGTKHKTGFFLDQRENRKELASYCDNKTVLDLCCHTGAFSVYAKARGNASRVIGVDLDPIAISRARQNAALNGAEIEFVENDLFPWLENAVKEKKTFDVVILDPARLTRSAEKLRQAISAYYAMNRLALQVVEKGGLFLSCSCTGLIKEETFLGILRDAAASLGRELQIFKVSGAAADHPFMANAPESRYLKAVWARVR